MHCEGGDSDALVASVHALGVIVHEACEQKFASVASLIACLMLLTQLGLKVGEPQLAALMAA
jgi:hypothetical protein